MLSKASSAGRYTEFKNGMVLIWRKTHFEGWKIPISSNNLYIAILLGIIMRPSN